MTTSSAIAETNLPNLLHRGKVRDTYDLGDGLLLMVATDRISAFDVVLPTPVPEKGVVLAGLSAFWFRQTQHLVPNHLVALAEDEAALAWALHCRRCLERLPAGRWWCTARSEWTSSASPGGTSPARPGASTGGRAQSTASPCRRGCRRATDSPSRCSRPRPRRRRATTSPSPAQSSQAWWERSWPGELERLTVAVYQWAHDYALPRGIILADTKVEFGTLNGQLILIDELLTPDSSRFWDGASYRPGQSQPNFDKQYVRDWLTEAGWDREPPAPELPPEVVERSRERYFEAYRLLIGESVPQ